jgi:hypothetical protein
MRKFVHAVAIVSLVALSPSAALAHPGSQGDGAAWCPLYDPPGSASTGVWWHLLPCWAQAFYHV